jgi:hypothetical protein
VENAEQRAKQSVGTQKAKQSVKQRAKQNDEIELFIIKIEFSHKFYNKSKHLKMTTYTFIYCMMHDEGCIITGDHSYVPEGYKMQHCTECESCDWHNMGVIRKNGPSFEIIERVRVEYDRYYGGGFIFRLYLNTLTDEKGNKAEDKALDKWIEEIAADGKHRTFLD